MKKEKKLSTFNFQLSIVLMLAFMGLSLNGAFAQREYWVLSQVGEKYYLSLHVDGQFDHAIGDDADLTTTFNKIREDTRGRTCTIRFGTESWTNNFWDHRGLISNTGATYPWGKIILIGGGSGNASTYIIGIQDGITVDCMARISNTGSGAAINNSGTLTMGNGGDLWSKSGSAIVNSGIVNVNEGNVWTDTGVGIRNNSTGTVNISGGNVTGGQAGGRAIYNVSSGTVNISGTAQVLSSTGIAVDNSSTGKITVSGNATVKSANVNSSTPGTIYLNNSGAATTDRLVVNGGKIENWEAGGVAVYNASPGAISISGGTVQAQNIAIRNNNTGLLTVTGGTVQVNTGVAVWNNSTGDLNINNGTVLAAAAGGRAIYNLSGGNVSIRNSALVSSTTGIAVDNASTGRITVSNSATVTSANVNSSAPGTIYLYNNGTSTSIRLSITGGTVKNTAAGGVAICNTSRGSISITGGTVSTTTGNAIRKNNTGQLNISGGTVSATTGDAVWNDNAGEINISGGTVTSAGGAIVNNGAGTLNISGTAKVTTTATNTYSAIYNPSTGAVNIEGNAEVSGGGSYAIYNASTGKITILGNAIVTSANSNGSQGTVCLTVTSASTADLLEIISGTVRNTASGGVAIRNASGRAVSVTGGTVETTTGVAIQNNNNATLNISKGTVRATGAGGRAIYNTSTGAVNISGTAFVSSTTGIAVDNSNTGKITVSGGTVTSANVNSSAPGTIYLYNNGTATADRLVISGGTVSNTATNGTALYNGSAGAVSISGGTVQANNGTSIQNARTGEVTVSGTAQVSSLNTNPTVYNTSSGKITINGGIIWGAGNIAVRNNSSGTVTVNNGMIRTTGGLAISNSSSGTVSINGGIVFSYGTQITDIMSGNYSNNSSGSGIIVAWNQAAGKTNYATGTSEHIFKSPSAAVAVWGKQGATNGISVSYKTNTGIIPLGVTVGDAASLSGTVSITGTAAFGGTLTANTGGLTPTPLGTLSYQWKRGSTNIGSNSATYTLTQADIGSTINVTVTSANYSGSVTSAPTATVAKATQTPPAAPTMASRISTSITLNAIAGCEYRRGTGAWQTSTTFSGLTPNTDYRFTARRAETATHSASSASPEATISTTTGVGIEELKIENGKLKIYPNPTSGELRVESGELQVEDYRIFNVAGQMLMQGKILEESPIINVTSLASGIYYLRAGDKTVKFVKK